MNVINKEQQQKERFAERLKQATEHAGLPAKGRGKLIAAELGITPKSVSRWFTAETMPAREHITSLARLLSVSEEWLTFGRDRSVSVSDAVEIPQFPLLTMAQASKWTGIDDLLTSGETFTMISQSVQASKNSFYIKLEDNSMLKNFKPGDVILIDPEVKPVPGAGIAVKDSSGIMMFRIYKELATAREDGTPHFEAAPSNDVYPTLSSEVEQLTIVGTAIQQIIKLSVI